jgi:carbon-monoxide dehydrogenase medium subunit
MIPAAFDYVRAGSADEALAALAEHGDDAKVLAGGHSLIPLMRFRLVTPGVIVDVGGLNGSLRGISVDGDTITIGALTRHSELEHSAELAEAAPLLAHVASLVGDPAVRHRGTLGGSIAHADPASDLPAAMLALGATLVAQGPGGEREIAIDDFFTGFLESALAPDELLTAVKVPVSTGGWAYEKFNRRAQDWAVVGVAVAEGGKGVSLVNMAQTPHRAVAVQNAVAGGASAADAAAAAPEGAAPPTDNNGDAAYRNHLAQVLTERALSRAMG